MSESLIKRSKKIFRDELVLQKNNELLETFQKNRFWCSISLTYDDKLSVGVGVPKHADEVKSDLSNWLCENCEGKYLFDLEQNVQYTPNNNNITFYISFEVIADATHFKMRWL